MLRNPVVRASCFWDSISSLPHSERGQATQGIRDRIKTRVHESVKVIGKWLGGVVGGYFTYHAVPDNLRRLESFCNEVIRIWLRALRRRSQRHRMRWTRFKHLTNMYCHRPACNTHIRQNALAVLPEARARCVNCACRDLCGARGAIRVPTATQAVLHNQRTAEWPNLACGSVYIRPLDAAQRQRPICI
jgi:hypothetical protein